MATQKMQAMQLMDYDEGVQQQQITRQQAMAEALRKQSMEPMGGTETIGGWAIKKSPWESVSKIGQALAASYASNQADKAQSDLTKASGQKLADTLSNYQSDLQGKPAQSYQVTDDEYGPQTVNAPAVAPNKQAALARLLGSGNTSLQQMGMQQMLAQPQNPFGKIDPKDYTPDSIRKFAASQNFADLAPVAVSQFGKIDAKDYTPDSQKIFAATGNHSDLVPIREMKIGPAGQAYNGYTMQPGDVLADPNKPFAISAGGAAVPNMPYQVYEKEKAQAGASNIKNTLSVAGPENAYNQDVGKGLAATGLSLVDNARAAPETIRNAQSILAALDKGAITGTGAEMRLAMQKALETAGIVGEGKAANTQALMAGLSKITLSGIKTSGLGAGQGFTNTDRIFLDSAISGSIDSTPANLRRAADLSERVARANHGKGTTVLNRWKNDKALGAVAQDSTIDDIPAALTPGGGIPQMSAIDAEIARRKGGR